jgi:hypothetical protein
MLITAITTCSTSSLWLYSTADEVITSELPVVAEPVIDVVDVIAAVVAILVVATAVVPVLPVVAVVPVVGIGTSNDIVTCVTSLSFT